MDSFTQPVVEDLTDVDFTEDIKVEDHINKQVELESSVSVTVTDKPLELKAEASTTPPDAIGTAKPTVPPASSAEPVPVEDKPVGDKPVGTQCSLCKCHLASLIAAKHHYEGRRHQRTFITIIKNKHEYYSAIGTGKQPIKPKSEASSGDGAATESDGPEHICMYCFVCDVQMNSDDQAVQHYSGRKHRHRTSSTALPTASPRKTGQNLKRKAQGLEQEHQFAFKRPAVKIQGGGAKVRQNAGGLKNTHNPAGPKSTLNPGGPKNTPDIGGPKNTTSTGGPTGTAKELPNSGGLKAKKKKSEQTEKGQEFTCKLCKINVTSKDLLIGHLKGMKHQKRVARLEAPAYTNMKMQGKFMGNSRMGRGGKNARGSNKMNHGRNMNRMNMMQAAPPSMVSITCEICSVTMNSQIQFQQHLQSQKHLANAGHFSHQINSLAYGGSNFNPQNKSRKSQYGYNKFVKRGRGGAKNQQQNWARSSVNNDVQNEVNNWPQQNDWQQSEGKVQVEGAQGMDYQTDTYSNLQYQSTPKESQHQQQYTPPESKLTAQTSYAQIPQYAMSYTEDNYYNA